MQRMKTVKTIDNQTILDFALMWYGTAEAVAEIMELNPGIRNETSALIEEGIAPGSFYMDIELAKDMDVIIDDNSQLIRKNILKNINTEITTYTSKQWQERLNK